MAVAQTSKLGHIGFLVMFWLNHIPQSIAFKKVEQTFNLKQIYVFFTKSQGRFPCNKTSVSFLAHHEQASNGGNFHEV